MGRDPTKQIKVSRADSESGYMVRDDKPKGFFYLIIVRSTPSTQSLPTQASLCTLAWLEKVMQQCLLAATGQNMKKIALMLVQLLPCIDVLIGPKRACAALRSQIL